MEMFFGSEEELPREKKEEEAREMNSNLRKEQKKLTQQWVEERSRFGRGLLRTAGSSAVLGGACCGLTSLLGGGGMRCMMVGMGIWTTLSLCVGYVVAKRYLVGAVLKKASDIQCAEPVSSGDVKGVKGTYYLENGTRVDYVKTHARIYTRFRYRDLKMEGCGALIRGVAVVGVSLGMFCGGYKAVGSGIDWVKEKMLGAPPAPAAMSLEK